MVILSRKYPGKEIIIIFVVIIIISIITTVWLYYNAIHYTLEVDIIMGCLVPN